MFYDGAVTPPVTAPCNQPSNIVYADQLTSAIYDVVAGTKLVVPHGFVYSLAVMDMIVHECAVLEVFGTLIIDGNDLENYGTVIIHNSGGAYLNGGNYQGNGGSLSGSISIN